MLAHSASLPMSERDRAEIERSAEEARKIVLKGKLITPRLTVT